MLRFFKGILKSIFHKHKFILEGKIFLLDEGSTIFLYECLYCGKRKALHDSKIANKSIIEKVRLWIKHELEIQYF